VPYWPYDSIAKDRKIPSAPIPYVESEQVLRVLGSRTKLDDLICGGVQGGKDRLQVFGMLEKRSGRFRLVIVGPQKLTLTSAPLVLDHPQKRHSTASQVHAAGIL
jgi:hypothetical protein